MENETNEIYAAFGLDAPSEDAADTTASEVPADDPGTGPEDSKPADAEEPAAEEAEAEDVSEDEDAQEEEAPDEPVQKVQPVQEPDTSAEDAAYAATFMGRKNPYTGKPITSKADYQQYLRDREAAEEQARQQAADDELKNIGITEQQLEALLSRTEIGKKMQAAMDFTQKQAAQAHQDAIQKLIDADIAEIGKYDPTVKDVDSLKKTARGDAIAKRVASGRYTWLEAYKLENFDAMQNARSDAAKQAALNTANSKNHLQSTAQRGAGENDVPRDMQEIYRAMGINDKEEMRSSYNDYMKLIKKG